jgi:hypothetical protein
MCANRTLAAADVFIMLLLLLEFLLALRPDFLPSSQLNAQVCIARLAQHGISGASVPNQPRMMSLGEYQFPPENNAQSK